MSNPFNELVFAMNINCSIVFLYDRFSWHLPYVLYQAKHACLNNSDIIFLGSNYKCPGINTIPLKSLSNKLAASFMESYKYMSSNPASFELICWLRWFYLLECMKKNKLEAVLHLDPDVLLYSSLSDIFDSHIPVDTFCALSIPEQDFESFMWVASGHISYWTLSSLEEFCDFMIRSFQDRAIFNHYLNKWEWHNSHNKRGGICDMTALYLFWKNRRRNIENLATSKRGCVFDHCINISSNYHEGEYLIRNSIKKVTFVDQKPHFSLANDRQTHIQAHALHFQGPAKMFIPSYYRGPSFAGKLRSDTKSLALRSKRNMKQVLKRVCNRFIVNGLDHKNGF